jgi:Rps23 Pro-64 3,4-dihydroxylase Tpa1-like proline 4-hydroxylase
LTDPDDPWHAEDGGALELYPLVPDSIESRCEEEGGIQGIPTATPTKCIVPTFNSMAIFRVQPGRSYHSVQEVYAHKPRISISGWFHCTTPPAGADKGLKLDNSFKILVTNYSYTYIL